MQLAKHHPREILFAARTQLKAEDVQEIKGDVHKSDISHIKLGIASFHTVKEEAEGFKSRSEGLDILMNNAGDYSCTRSQAQV